MKAGLRALGYDIEASDSQIVALESGTEADTIRLRDALESRGIFGAVFCAPATAKERALLRFSLGSELRDSEVERVLQVCDDIRDEVGMHQWRSTRQLRNRNARASMHRD